MAGKSLNILLYHLAVLVLILKTEKLENILNFIHLLLLETLPGAECPIVVKKYGEGSGEMAQ